MQAQRLLDINADRMDCRDAILTDLRLIFLVAMQRQHNDDMQQAIEALGSWLVDHDPIECGKWVALLALDMQHHLRVDVSYAKSAMALVLRDERRRRGLE